METQTPTITEYTDDIENKPFVEGDGETLTFSFGGRSYEIDLNTKNADKMRKTFGFYVDHAHPVSGASTATTRTRASSSTSRSTGGRDYDLADLRVWAEKKASSYRVEDGSRVRSSSSTRHRAADRLPLNTRVRDTILTSLSARQRDSLRRASETV